MNGLSPSHSPHLLRELGTHTVACVRRLVTTPAITWEIDHVAFFLCPHTFHGFWNLRLIPATSVLHILCLICAKRQGSYIQFFRFTTYPFWEMIFNYLLEMWRVAIAHHSIYSSEVLVRIFLSKTSTKFVPGFPSRPTSFKYSNQHICAAGSIFCWDCVHLPGSSGVWVWYEGGQPLLLVSSQLNHELKECIQSNLLLGQEATPETNVALYTTAIVSLDSVSLDIRGTDQNYSENSWSPLNMCSPFLLRKAFDEKPTWCLQDRVQFKYEEHLLGSIKVRRSVSGQTIWQEKQLFILFLMTTV